MILTVNMAKKFSKGLIWFRRDLRVQDNAALHLALSSCEEVHAVFIFDSEILDQLPKADRRVDFIQASVAELDVELQNLSGKSGSGLIVAHGKAIEEIPLLARELGVQAVFCAYDYEPTAQIRDQSVTVELREIGVELQTCKDHVIFEKREILTLQGQPYGVFTPYKNNWLSKIKIENIRDFNVGLLAFGLAVRPENYQKPVPSLEALGFNSSHLRDLLIPTGASGAQSLLADFLKRMDNYHVARDFPSIKGPSYLGIHLRFGTISIRELVSQALKRKASGSEGASIWLSELVWRDFYFQILSNFPRVATGAYKTEYDAIVWEDGPRALDLFKSWCDGRTGYPLVDAAMAQINQTGYMHNRLRMVVGSFLVKDLGIDWRWGERYFSENLNDFDLSANNGGWQWVSSSGCDAQPYFRIFNPINQSQKFDPDGQFIKRYLPQLKKLPTKFIHTPWLAPKLILEVADVYLGDNYPLPLVDHKQARARTLLRYSAVKKP